MIKAIIIEDEEAAATRLRKIIGEVAPDVEVIHRLDSIESAVEWFTINEAPPLVFLDIQLADGLSFEIFKSVTIDSFIVFTTAFDEYAIKAFELNSIDYLLKPIKKEKLSNSIAKFKSLQQRTSSSSVHDLIAMVEEQKKSYKKRFMISLGSRIASIETTEIAYFYYQEGSTYLKTNAGKNYPIDYSLEKLENLLKPEDFFRINRQMMISFSSILKIHIMSKSRIKLELSPSFDEEVWVSSHKSSSFRVWLDK